MTFEMGLPKKRNSRNPRNLGRKTLLNLIQKALTTTEIHFTGSRPTL